MTAADHHVLTLALAQYHHTGEPQAVIPATEETRKSVAQLKRHKYIRTVEKLGDKAVEVTLTLRGLAAALTLPAEPDGPLKARAKLADQRARYALEDEVLLALLRNPTIPQGAGDVAEAIDKEGQEIQIGHALSRLRQRDAVEVAISSPNGFESDMYVPTLQTVQNYLHQRYPNREDYEAAKARIIGRTIAED